jgi:hypothetical protein
MREGVVELEQDGSLVNIEIELQHSVAPSKVVDATLK